MPGEGRPIGIIKCLDNVGLEIRGGSNVEAADLSLLRWAIDQGMPQRVISMASASKLGTLPKPAVSIGGLGVPLPRYISCRPQSVVRCRGGASRDRCCLRSASSWNANRFSGEQLIGTPTLVHHLWYKTVQSDSQLAEILVPFSD